MMQSPWILRESWRAISIFFILCLTLDRQQSRFRKDDVKGRHEIQVIFKDK